MDRTTLLQKLSEELSAKSVFDDFELNVKALKSDNLRLGIMGQPNTAKTTLVNCLVSTSLPVSTLPSKTNYVISHGTEERNSSTNEINQSVIEIKVDSEWLKSNKLTISEINNDIIPDEATAMGMKTK